MNTHPSHRRLLSGVIALGFAAGMASGAAHAAAPKANSLTGMWTLNQTDFDHKEGAQDQSEVAPPYSDEAQKIIANQTRAVTVDLEVLSDAGKKCLPIGMPGFMSNEFALEILETPGRITLLNEASSIPRTIYLNRSSPTEGVEPMWNGFSVGRWQGNTLLVETTHLNETGSPISFGGGIHAPTTTISERMYLEKDGNSLVVETTFHDARYLRRPWTTVHHFTRLPADAELWEYVCQIDAEGWSERYAGEKKESAAGKK